MTELITFFTFSKQSSDDEDCSTKGRNRHIVVNKAELANSIEVLESFKLARESWELLYSLEFLDKEFTRICLAWKTDTWLWLRIFLTDMIIYQGQYKKAIASLHHLAALQGSLPQPQITGQGTLEHQRALIQLATCHFALGEYRMTCEKVLDLMCYMVLPIQDGGKSQEEPSKIKPKFRKGSDLKLLPCTSKAIMPFCLHLMLACFKLRAFADSRDDMALGHVIVLLQQEWPRGENLFLKAVSKICQQGNFQYENFFNYVNSIQPSLFQGPNAPSQVPLVLLEDVSNVYGDVEIDRNKHIHKKRKLAEGREKTMSSDDEDCSTKGRNRHIVVNKAELANSIEVLESFKLARESWELLYSLEFLDKEFTRICLAWKTDTWLWLRIFLTDMIIYQGQYKKAIASLHHLAALQGSLPQPQITGQGTLEHQRALIQLATCHFALGEYRMTCEKVLDLMCYMVLPIQDGGKSQEEPSKIKPKFRKGSDLKLLPCTSKAIMPFCLHLMLACFKLRAFADSRDDMALGHVIVLLQQEWPRGENLFLKAVSKICQQGNFQYENFFNYVTNIDMLEEFAYLRTQEGGKIHLELLPNQGMLIKPSSPPMGLLQQEFLPVLQPSIQTADRHHTVTRGITKGVKEDFRLAMERQVSRCGENLMVVLHRFCINEKILLLQTLA